MISVNRPGAERADTVGPRLPGVEVRLSEEGELLVRGANVMTGYWNDPESTSAALIDGWLHTGDLAEIDSDGHIRIVGRLKDLIVNSGGDNIAPVLLSKSSVSSQKLIKSLWSAMHVRGYRHLFSDSVETTV